MPTNTYSRPTASAPPAVPPLLIPQPSIAPLVPPAHVVDLMTLDGSAVLGAHWKAKEAKLVECPALSDSMPEFTTTYDVEPHAELLGFDDSKWAPVAATELGARRGGGMGRLLLVPCHADDTRARHRIRHQWRESGAVWHRRVVDRRCRGSLILVEAN